MEPRDSAATGTRPSLIASDLTDTSTVTVGCVAAVELGADWARHHAAEAKTATRAIKLRTMRMVMSPKVAFILPRVRWKSTICRSVEMNRENPTRL